VEHQFYLKIKNTIVKRRKKLKEISNLKSSAPDLIYHFFTAHFFLLSFIDNCYHSKGGASAAAGNYPTNACLNFPDAVTK
jgi:hypothetical protein